MTREIRYSRLQRSIEPCHVPSLQSSNTLTYDVHGTPRHLARGHGPLKEKLGHMGHKPFERGRRHRGPNQPLDNRGIGGVQGMQMGVGFPFFKGSVASFRL